VVSAAKNLALSEEYRAHWLGEDVDPQHLNTLAHALENWKVFTIAEVNEWCEIWFRNRMALTGGEHKRLNGLLDLAV
jgi:type I restriction enzyme R subunit